jgi:TetR/AcrR family transcriptional regulator
MARPKPENDSATRQQILRVALKRFAHAGFAATSIQQIVDDAGVSKPALYYYFQGKTGLFQALLNEAHDEHYRLMQAAAGRADRLREKLEEILTALFADFQKNRERMRMSLATMFAAPGEVPPGIRYLDRCQRNFEFIHSLIKQALAAGELDRRYESRELTYGYYGQAHLYLMAGLIMPDCRLNRRTAERIVDLFFTGAAVGKRKGENVSVIKKVTRGNS